MSAFADIDLSRLPAPDLVELLDFEEIYEAARQDLVALMPEFDAAVESDPAVKLLQVFAYREMLLRQRVNDAARATMLAFAGGADLDHIGALFSVARAELDPGDPAAVPPVAPTLEDDARLRSRIQLALEASTAAGTAPRYAFFALQADPRVADVSVTSSYPGKVDIHVLSSEGDGTPAPDVIQAVTAAVMRDDVRQLCDSVGVFPAQVASYDVRATLTLLPGAGGDAALAEARARLEALTADLNRLGRDVTRSALIAALHVDGVHSVDLIAPAADVTVGVGQVARPAALVVGVGGVDV